MNVPTWVENDREKRILWSKARACETPPEFLGSYDETKAYVEMYELHLREKERKAREDIAIMK